MTPWLNIEGEGLCSQKTTRELPHPLPLPLLALGSVCTQHMPDARLAAWQSVLQHSNSVRSTPGWLLQGWLLYSVLTGQAPKLEHLLCVGTPDSKEAAHVLSLLCIG